MSIFKERCFVCEVEDELGGRERHTKSSHYLPVENKPGKKGIRRRIKKNI